MDNFSDSLLNSMLQVAAPILPFLFFIILGSIPVLLGIFFWRSWLTYIRTAWIHSQQTILLELRLPKEMVKSPRSMELFLTSLYQTKGESTFIDRLWLGKMRSWFSLELVSIEGEVRFFIWMHSKWRNIIESALYAQYPEIEIYESNDYVDLVPLDHDKYEMWGQTMKLKKSSHYPIKTYVDFNLDDDAKEEYKIDPITPIIEFLGSLKENEYAWIQIIVRAHKSETPKPDGKFGEKVDWTHAAKEEIKKLTKKDGTKEVGELKIPDLSLTKGEKFTIESIERNVAKLAFDTGIRMIYIARKEIFNDINIAGLTGSFRQFNSAELNSFDTQNKVGFDYPWQDWFGKKILTQKEHMHHEYKERAYFFGTHHEHPFVMSSEALATIYHFPGQVSKTPSFERIGAKKSQAPANLPM